MLRVCLEEQCALRVCLEEQCALRVCPEEQCALRVCLEARCALRRSVPLQGHLNEEIVYVKLCIAVTSVLNEKSWQIYPVLTRYSPVSLVVNSSNAIFPCIS